CRGRAGGPGGPEGHGGRLSAGGGPDNRPGGNGPQGGPAPSRARLTRTGEIGEDTRDWCSTPNDARNVGPRWRSPVICPYCSANDDKVIDSRSSEGGRVIRRRRQCLKCGKRFTTYERVEQTARLIVVKRDGTR